MCKTLSDGQMVMFYTAISEGRRTKWKANEWTWPFVIWDYASNKGIYVNPIWLKKAIGEMNMNSCSLADKEGKALVETTVIP